MNAPTVATISTAEHLAFVAKSPAVSFLQTPAWGRVKSEWHAESVGWYDAGALAGAALVLYRRIPRLGRSLAYLPEGPSLDWARVVDPNHGGPDAWLAPLVEHVRGAGAFGVRIGPPVVVRRWSAAQVKAGLADPAIGSLDRLPPTERTALGARLTTGLLAGGWRPQSGSGGFAAGQPAYNFWLPMAGRTEADVLAGMNQLWRRNIKKADKAGVEVATSTAPGDLAAFHALYAETAARDGFTPRPLAYFDTMMRELGAEDPGRIRLYLARHAGQLVAATIWVRVGEHAWYSYGASSTEHREVRGSNAIQWRMIRDALHEGAGVYDLRGITDTLDPADPHAGLVQFKVGTGGEAVEYAGEWDLPLNRALYHAFSLYLRRR